MVNNIIISGNVTRNAEKRGTQEKPYITFGIAATAYKGGEKKDSMFFSCIMFGKRAQNVADYIEKGAKVVVSGALDTDNYTDKNGIEHKGFSIKVSDVELMGGIVKKESGWN